MLFFFLLYKLTTSTVDGASWRTSNTAVGVGLQYPDCLLSGEAIEDVKGKKKKSESKL